MDGPSGALRDPGCATPASDCRRLHRTGSNVPTAAEALVLGPGARARQRDEEQVERRARGQAASMRLALLTVLPDAGDAARHDEMADSTRRERASQQSSFFATRRPSSRASSSQRDRTAHARLVDGARRGASTARLMQLALGAGDGHRRPRLVGGRHDRAEKARDHRSDHGGPRGGHAGPRGLETGPLYFATLLRHPADGHTGSATLASRFSAARLGPRPQVLGCGAVGFCRLVGFVAFWVQESGLVLTKRQSGVFG